MLCLIDNYDSFTYNIVQYLGEVGVKPLVVKNDAMRIDELRTAGIQKFIISPGPCTPNESGISLEVIKIFSDKHPIFGICLGHEAIGQVFGGQIVHARQVMHGKVSTVYHDQKGIFSGLPSPIKATRYHSLIIDKETFPENELEITAWTVDSAGNVDEIMGVRHRIFNVEGVQFHPEAILTENGHKMFKNFCFPNNV